MASPRAAAAALAAAALAAAGCGSGGKGGAASGYAGDGATVTAVSGGGAAAPGATVTAPAPRAKPPTHDEVICRNQAYGSSGFAERVLFGIGAGGRPVAGTRTVRAGRGVCVVVLSQDARAHQVAIAGVLLTVPAQRSAVARLRAPRRGRYPLSIDGRTTAAVLAVR